MLKPKPDDDFEILTLQETAEFLKISEKTVMRMVKRRDIPSTKIAGQWRFIRSVLIDWLLNRTLVPDETESDTQTAFDRDFVPELSSYTEENHIIIPLAGGSKREILRRLVVPLHLDGYVENPEEFIRLLLEREDLATTAMGGGLAVPHVRNPRNCPSAVARIVLGINSMGIDYGAVDGKPVHLVFLICTESEGLHLRLIARIAQLNRDPDIAGRIVRATNPLEAYSLIVEFDRRRQP